LSRTFELSRILSGGHGEYEIQEFYKGLAERNPSSGDKHIPLLSTVLYGSTFLNDFVLAISTSMADRVMGTVKKEIPKTIVYEFPVQLSLETQLGSNALRKRTMQEISEKFDEVVKHTILQARKDALPDSDEFAEAVFGTRASIPTTSKNGGSMTKDRVVARFMGGCARWCVDIFPDTSSTPKQAGGMQLNPQEEARKFSHTQVLHRMCITASVSSRSLWELENDVDNSMGNGSVPAASSSSIPMELDDGSGAIAPTIKTSRIQKSSFETDMEAFSMHEGAMFRSRRAPSLGTRVGSSFLGSAVDSGPVARPSSVDAPRLRNRPARRGKALGADVARPSHAGVSGIRHRLMPQNNIHAQGGWQGVRAPMRGRDAAQAVRATTPRQQLISSQQLAMHRRMLLANQFGQVVCQGQPKRSSHAAR
jgi:hypothetical protein